MIIGIDPGPEYSALASFHLARGQTTFAPITKGAEFDNRWPNKNVIQFLKELRETTPITIACESFEFQGRPLGKVGFDTLMWIGEFRRVAKDRGFEFHELRAGADIKMNICGVKNAKKAWVSQALRDRFGEKGTVKAPGPTFGFASHLWDALAATVTAYDKFYGGKP
jgi:hypothetical protein